MSGAPFHVEVLADGHDRLRFDSGEAPLDRYLREQVSQDVRRRVAACFVAVPAEDQACIAGYYTLASASVPLDLLPQATAKKLPRYPAVPAVRMGRLAVDHQFKGMGLGAALLVDALQRCARSDIAAYALIVEAKGDTAAAFYRHHGFIALPSAPLTLFLPVATMASAAKPRGK